MAELDHIVVSAATLDAGAAYLSRRLGATCSDIGHHPYMGTHNRLVGLGPGLYLEVIAVDPDAPHPGRARWFGLDNFSGPPRLTNWMVRTSDLDAALAKAPPGSGTAISLSRNDYRWRIALNGTGRFPFDDAFPGLIEWQGGLDPSMRLPDQGIRLLALEISTPDPAAFAAALPGIDDDRLWIVPGQTGIRAHLSTPGGETWL
ncbi:MAG: VOC family protein [Pseudomonadota bacterium]|jgi:hypothetical protein